MKRHPGLLTILAAPVLMVQCAPACDPLPAPPPPVTVEVPPVATSAAPPTSVTSPPTTPSSTTLSEPPVSQQLWPTKVSGRRVVDQFGGTYLMKAFSSWGMAQNLNDSQITEALEAVARRGFNAVTVAPNGVGIQAEWSKYQNVAGARFFTATPFASSLGPAWATMDHIVAESQRLGITVLFSFFVSFAESGIGPDLVAASQTDAYDYGVAVASRYRGAPNIVWHVEAD